ncbi:MAG: DUF4136 domain-containing protein [Limnobacter sp.]|nr:DUF4136 domain-containing protein [Limnobacter sp.]
MLLAGGCATTVTSDVTVFHEWPADAPRSFRIATTPEQLESLEHADYRRQLRAELALLGFVESPSPRFEVRFDTDVLARSERRVEYAYPYYVQPWFGWGTWGSHGGFAMSMPWPGWGAGYGVEREFVWYEYRLSIEFRDLATGRKVFEAKAATLGDSPSIASAMPFLLRSVLADFPGLSGVSRRVEIPVSAVPAGSEPPPSGSAAPAGSAAPDHAPRPSGSSAPPPGGPPMR